jgi:hypothetical protein
MYLDSPVAFIAVVYFVLLAFVNLCFAVVVLADARRFDPPGAPRIPRPKRQLVLVGPGIWAFATLLGGVFAAAIYWAIHHSTLNPEVARAETPAVSEPA